MENKKNSKSFKLVLIITIFLVGLMLISNVIVVFNNLYNQLWSYININNILNQFLYTITLLFCFVILITFLIKKKIFNIIAGMLGKFLGIIYILASIVFPRIEGYTVINFEMFSFKNIVLIDGQIFVVGMLIIIFSIIIHSGIYIQNDLDSFI